jgi:hypothetical protein
MLDQLSISSQPPQADDDAAKNVIIRVPLCLKLCPVSPAPMQGGVF